MSWVAVGAAAVTVVGGAINANSAKKSAASANAGQQAAIAEQQRQYDQTRQDQMPWLQAGTNSLGQMQALNAGDFSSFKQSPDYKFAYDQGLATLDRSAARNGNLFSGGHQADLMKFGQGLASQNYNTYYNRLASMAGVGQNTAANLGSFGQNAANNIGNSLTAMGNNRASMYQQQGDNMGQAVGAIGGIFNNWAQQRSANKGGG